MEEKKRNIRIDQDGTCHAPVPMWQELPQITVRLEEGNTTYRFTGLPAALMGNTHFPKKW